MTVPFGNDTTDTFLQQWNTHNKIAYINAIIQLTPSCNSGITYTHITNNIVPVTNKVDLKQRTKEINNERLTQFHLQLANESWESVYIDNDTNKKFNSFPRTLLNIFEASLLVKYTETIMAGLHKD
jgi:hypothetical protein